MWLAISSTNRGPKIVFYWVLYALVSSGDALETAIAKWRHRRGRGVMYRGQLAKFTQVAGLGKLLDETGDGVLVLSLAEPGFWSGPMPRRIVMECARGAYIVSMG